MDTAAGDTTKPDPGLRKPTRQSWQGTRRLLRLCQNPMSLLGLFVATMGLILVITYLLFSIVTKQHNPYLDFIGYLILPTIFVAGLVMVPLGALWKWHWYRQHEGVKAPRRVHVDLGDRANLTAIGIFTGITCFIVLPIVGLSSYRGYLYTESTGFCVNVCHTVMQPEGTAHANSPHARVTCAECHIGAGADWFVKSKLSGTRQVFAVMWDTYSRPIPPAITELRPARDTCEHCHWPAKFHGSQLKQVVHYAPDESNTRRMVRMLLNTGGADESIGRVEGIHMHMMVNGGIDYVATDDKLQEIPWVRYEKPSGEVVVYRSDGEPHDAPPPAGVERTVDCMDCHNRGAHHFRSPMTAVDLQIEAGRIDPGLPYIKREAVAALAEGYTDVATAEEAIRDRLETFYQQEFPTRWAREQPVIETAITRIQEIYRQEFFPAMQVDWRSYPENIGHLTSPGCFRCHDGRHVDPAGTPIDSDCNVCHTFLNEIDDRPNQFEESTFQHSMSLRHHENLRCEQCHTGGPLPLCYDCHTAMGGLQDWRDVGRLRRDPRHEP